MFQDPIVEEVRRARNDYARSMDYDLDAICRDLQQKQRESGRAVVSFPPKHVLENAQASHQVPGAPDR